MQVLLINGSPHPKGSTATALATVAGQLEKAGIETTTLHVGHKAIRGCIACGKCARTGLCVFKDDPVNECIERMREADGLVVGSPVYYAGPNASLCALLDRMFYMKSAPYAFKPAAAVVSCRRGGASASFDRLNKYFTIARMPVVSSQYWNSIHGNNAEEAVQDAEGLQIMRALGDNMAWLLQCIEAGKKAGITPPAGEAWQPTNFIRSTGAAGAKIGRPSGLPFFVSPLDRAGMETLPSDRQRPATRRLPGRDPRGRARAAFGGGRPPARGKRAPFPQNRHRARTNGEGCRRTQ